MKLSGWMFFSGFYMFTYNMINANDDDLENQVLSFSTRLVATYLAMFTLLAVIVGVAMLDSRQGMRIMDGLLRDILQPLVLMTSFSFRRISVQTVGIAIRKLNEWNNHTINDAIFAILLHGVLVAIMMPAHYLYMVPSTVAGRLAIEKSAD
jgi:hypothetical protein